MDEELGQFAQYLEWYAEVVLDEDADTAKAYWQACLPSTGVLAPELPVRYADIAPGKAGGQTLTAALDPRVLERSEPTGSPAQHAGDHAIACSLVGAAGARQWARRFCRGPAA